MFGLFGVLTICWKRAVRPVRYADYSSNCEIFECRCSARKQSNSEQCSPNTYCPVFDGPCWFLRLNGSFKSCDLCWLCHIGKTFFSGAVCTVGRWEVIDKNGISIKYIDRDCSDRESAKAKAGKKNCNDVKVDLTGEKHEACWAVCEGHLCNGTREVFASMVLMALIAILL